MQFCKCAELIISPPHFSEVLLENSGLAINFKLSQYSIKVVLGLFLQTPISQEASLPSTSHTSATHTRSSALVVSLTFILRTDDPCLAPQRSSKETSKFYRRWIWNYFKVHYCQLAPAKPHRIKNVDGIRATCVLFILSSATCRFMNLIPKEGNV